MLEVVEPGLDVLELLETLLVRKFPVFPDGLRGARVVRYFESWKKKKKTELLKKVSYDDQKIN